MTRLQTSEVEVTKIPSQLSSIANKMDEIRRRSIIKTFFAVMTTTGCTRMSPDERPSPTNETTPARTSSLTHTTGNDRNPMPTTSTPTTTSSTPRTTENDLDSTITTRTERTNNQSGCEREERPLTFSLAVTHSRTTAKRNQLLDCSNLILYGGTGHEQRSYDVGSQTKCLNFQGAVSEPKRRDQRTFRSFGNEATVMLLNQGHVIGSFSGITLVCRPNESSDTPVSISMSVDGGEPDSITVDNSDWRDYYLSFH